MIDAGFYNMDCMLGMAQFPDKFFELAIVDPIYGDVTQGGYMSNPHTCDKLAKAVDYHLSIWSNEKTPKSYFDELKRVSRNQIIWGGNYFQTSIGSDSQGWVVWDKENGDNNFADCELAWTSFNRATRMFRFRWAGMLQGNMKNKETRIHPTQKPIALYKWLLSNYAKPGDKILDTHVGSASSLIACHQMGSEYWGFELDADYYKAATERLNKVKAQVSMTELVKPIQARQIAIGGGLAYPK